jgi:hypothetical protein
MATIRMREHLDGTFAYQAIVRIKQQGKIVYRESKVFSKHQSAVNWAKRREVELQDPVELARARASRKTLAELTFVSRPSLDGQDPEPGSYAGA